MLDSDAVPHASSNPRILNITSGREAASWNVRELELGIRRFALTGREETIASLLLGHTPAKISLGAGVYHSSEKMVIMSALTSARWNRRQAAKDLGISYSTLRRRIDRYSLNDVAFKITGSTDNEPIGVR